MLYSPKQFAREQLHRDLAAVHDKLSKNWRKGGWQVGESLCIMAACQVVTGQQVGSLSAPETEDEQAIRYYRMVAKIYHTLTGKVPEQMKSAGRKIIGFNDGPATQAAVLLLLERAMEACLTPAEA